MRTCRLLCTVVAAVAGAALPAAPAIAQETMKMNISISQNSHYGVAVDTFAREVEKRTSGRYKVQNFYSGALGAERESIEAVQLGTLDLTMTSTGPVPNFVPEIAILDIPFLFRDYGHARATLDGPIGQDLLAKFPAKGIVALAWGENGFRQMTNNKRPVNVPDDLKGLKMRTMENPVHIQAYKAFGIIPTPMAFTELFTALQQGTVDGQENPLSVISAAKFDQVQKYMSLTGHVYSPALILMNKGKWDKLAAADKHGVRRVRQGGGEGQPRAHRRGRTPRRRGPARQGHDGGRGRGQVEIPGGPCADVRRIRQEVRPGQHRQDPQLPMTRSTPRGRVPRPAVAAPVAAPRRASRCAREPRVVARCVAPFSRSSGAPRHSHSRSHARCWSAAACLGLYQILSRFVFHQPAEWSEVLIRFTLIWMVFTGAPTAFRQGAMVCVDLAHRKAGPVGKRLLDTLAAVASLVLVGFMLWFGTEYAWRGRFQSISGLESFSMTWAYVAIPVGAVFCAIAIIGCLLDPRRHELETAQ